MAKPFEYTGHGCRTNFSVSSGPIPETEYNMVVICAVRFWYMHTPMEKFTDRKRLDM